jgi:hypothetical protein
VFFVLLLLYEAAQARDGQAEGGAVAAPSGGERRGDKPSTSFGRDAGCRRRRRAKEKAGQANDGVGHRRTLAELGPGGRGRPQVQVTADKLWPGGSGKKGPARSCGQAGGREEGVGGRRSDQRWAETPWGIRCTGWR